MEVLRHGKYVASAVPAVQGSLDDAERLFEAVNCSGLKYRMFETSYFHEDLYALGRHHSPAPSAAANKASLCVGILVNDNR